MPQEDSQRDQECDTHEKRRRKDGKILEHDSPLSGALGPDASCARRWPKPVVACRVAADGAPAPGIKTFAAR
jgi:hypothetical protein